MWKLALSQLRLHPRRYVAVMLAIVLGTMFLAASMLVASSAKQTTTNMLGATYANADLLVLPQSGATAEQHTDFAQLTGTLEQAGTLEQLDGVTEAYPVISGVAALVLPEDSSTRGNFDTNTDFVSVVNQPADSTLISAPITQGTLPQQDDGVTLDAATAERHDISVGDTVTLRTMADDTEYDFTVSGLIDMSMDPTVVGVTTAYLSDAAMSTFTDEYSTPSMALLRIDGPTDTVMATIQQHLDDSGTGATVNTPDHQVSEQLVDMLGFDAITVVLGGFALIALLVMMLVINNTFSVLVAQRTRQYALQRVLGATRGQLRRAVLAESTLIGIIGSLVGIGLAIAVMFGLIGLAKIWVPGAAFGMDVNIGWVLLAGTFITVIASWLPAAHAMRVSPLAAMRPVPEVTTGSKAGIFRLTIGALMLVGGGIGLIIFSNNGLILEAIAAGAISFIGVLALGSLFVPSAVYTLGWLPRAFGVPGKMAQLNAVRNRSRTAATATALMVGTTLVVLILTGGRTAQHNTDQMLATNFPVDITAHLETSDPAQAEDITNQLVDIPGIERAEALQPVATLTEPWSMDDSVYTADLAELANISAGLSTADVQALATPGTVLVPNHIDQETITVNTGVGEVELQTVVSDLPQTTALVSAATAQQFDTQDAGVTAVWLSVTHPDISQDDLQQLLNTISTETEISAQNMDSPLIMRIVYQEIIDTVMLTVIGLLGISVLIAFVGVANTLSLSALERTRENALMRALGLTKRGLRAMLTWEAILISAVGAILGSGLGMLYGWAGSVAIFQQITPDGLTMVWPWAETIAVIIVAVIAGLVASVIPSGKAAKVPPVQGLATE